LAASGVFIGINTRFFLSKKYMG
jgi:hypothetical protein